jgi:hypothetical protein
VESEELVRRYAAAIATNDFEVLQQLRDRDWHEDWPQSGERVPSDAVYRQIHENFPGGMPDIEVKELVGADDHWVVTPSMTVQRIAGSGDIWFLEGTNTYSGGERYYIVQLLHLRDGRVWRATTYFASPFDAPASRASLTVPIPAEPA